MTTTEHPDQPPGIDPYDYELPTPADAARRVNEFLTAYGDGLIEIEWSEDYLAQYGVTAKPLYARDLQALTNAVEEA